MAFLRVSADTILALPGFSCGSGAKSFAYWRFTFVCWQTYKYINRIPNNGKQKNEKKRNFLGRRFCIQEQ
jgi:hypothetical protein